MEQTHCEIALPEELYRKVEGKIAGSRFKSVRDYVVHAIKEMIAAEEAGDDLLTEEQRAGIEKRLRDLGYFD